jgi:hypothetical protein
MWGMAGDCGRWREWRDGGIVCVCDIKDASEGGMPDRDGAEAQMKASTLEQREYYNDLEAEREKTISLQKRVDEMERAHALAARALKTENKELKDREYRRLLTGKYVYVGDFNWETQIKKHTVYELFNARGEYMRPLSDEEEATLIPNLMKVAEARAGQMRRLIGELGRAVAEK